MSFVTVTIEVRNEDYPARDDEITVVSTRMGNAEKDDVIAEAADEAVERATAAARRGVEVA